MLEILLYLHIYPKYLLLFHLISTNMQDKMIINNQIACHDYDLTDLRSRSGWLHQDIIILHKHSLLLLITMK